MNAFILYLLLAYGGRAGARYFFSPDMAVAPERALLEVQLLVTWARGLDAMVLACK